jgi:hypothetical protein
MAIATHCVDDIMRSLDLRKRAELKPAISSMSVGFQIHASIGNMKPTDGACHGYQSRRGQC